MYRIFISHSWAYSSDYDKIDSFLHQEGIYFYNHSVPKSDPIHTNGTDKQLSDAIEAKIKGCSCVIILAGVYSTYSKWINKEIEMAKKYNVELYFNGHEHNYSSPTGVAGTMTDFSLGDFGGGGTYAVVTVKSKSATVKICDINSGNVRKTINYTFKLGVAK